MIHQPGPRIQRCLEGIQKFLHDEILPLEGAFLAGGFAAVESALAEKRDQVKSMGLWAPHLPESYGGLGLPLYDFAFISEALGRSPLGHLCFNCQAPDIGNMEILMQHGTTAQRERYFAPLAAGAVRSCFAMTEPEHAGSNPVLLSTSARKAGDHYIINGHKWFTSSFEGASFAIVMAVTNPDAEDPYARASQIIVPTDTPGVIHVRKIPVMGDAGEGYFSHSEIRFEDCRVPQSNLLGTEGRGFAIAQERLGPGRIHHCMRWIGICERALEMMCNYASRRQLAPGVPLASKQAIQDWLAQSRAEISASRLLVLETAAKIDAQGSFAARMDVSLIKFYVAGVLQRVIDRALQVHGGLGMTDDTLLSFWYRHERAARIYDGPDEVHKAVVARYLLKNYRLA